MKEIKKKKTIEIKFEKNDDGNLFIFFVEILLK